MSSRWRSIFFQTAVAAVWGVLVCSDLPAYVIRPIVLEGQSIPDSGGFFTGIGPFFINDQSAVVFRAATSRGPNSPGIFLYDGGRIRAVAETGQIVPGFSDLRFVQFSGPVINNHGDVAFSTTLAGQSGLQEAITIYSRNSFTLFFPGSSVGRVFGLRMNDSKDIVFVAEWGIFLYSNGILSTLSQNPSTLSGMPRVAPYAGASINNRGEVAWAKSLHGGSFLWAPPVGVAVYSPNANGRSYAPGYRLFVYHPAINDDGVVAFISTDLASYQEISRFFPDNAVRSVVTNSSIIPELLMKLQAFGAPSINNMGHVAFRAETSSGSVILYFEGTRINKVAVTNDLTASPAQSSFTSLDSDVQLNNTGKIAFAGKAAGSTSRGIFIAEPDLPNWMYAAHVIYGAVVGGSIVSTFVLTNPSKTAAVFGKIQVRTDDQRSVLIVDQNGVSGKNEFHFGLPPGQTAVYRMAGDGPIVSGFGEVSASGALTGSVLYSVPGFEAVRTELTSLFRQFSIGVAVDWKKGVNTGIAIANPSDHRIRGTFILQRYQSDEIHTRNVTLQPWQHGAWIIVGEPNSLFPELGTDKFQGTLRFAVTEIIGSVAATALLIEKGRFVPIQIAPSP